MMLGSVIGMSAYFTDADTATNEFTVGKVSLDMTETKWVGDNTGTALNITPLQETTKNPAITNDGINDEFVYLTVTVPVANIKTAAADGTVDSATAYTQLFAYGYEGNAGVSSDWTLIKSGNVNGLSIVKLGDKNDAVVSAITETTGDYGAVHFADTSKSKPDSITYVYAYTGSDSASLEALAAGKSTSDIFDYVKFTNAVEDQGLEATKVDITVNAYGIQTTNVLESTTYQGKNDDGSVDPTNVWAVVYTANPSTDAGTENAVTDKKTS
jgi:predicted ribosomally synthesized peptide with SipW-like signal peptide